MGIIKRIGTILDQIDVTKILMQMSITFFQKKLQTCAQCLSIAKWQYVYYTLAVFNLLTVSSGLYLSHQIMHIYTQSIAVNHRWATRLATYSDLGQLVAALNAPGNDIFDSKDVGLESRRLASAQAIFQRDLNIVRQELQTQVDSTQAIQLLQDLDTVEIETAKMVAEAKLIFSYFRQNQPEMAGRRMATMDRNYNQVNEALAISQQNVLQIQQNLLDEQNVAANSFRRYEFMIAGAMLLLIGGVTL